MTDPIEAAAQALYTNTTPAGLPNRWNDLYPEARIGYRSDARIAIAAWLEAVGMTSDKLTAAANWLSEPPMLLWAEAVRAVEQSS